MIGVIYEVLSTNVKRPAGLHSANVKWPAGLLLSDLRVAADLVYSNSAPGVLLESWSVHCIANKHHYKTNAYLFAVYFVSVPVL